jgi:uncharacterized integral membrane protein
MTESGVPTDSMRRGFTALKIILFLLLLIVFVSFVIKNMGSVDLYYYDYKLQMQVFSVPLFLVILATFTLGFLSAWFFGFLTQMRLKASLRKQTKAIQDMNEELGKLKAAPLQDTAKP